jgi:hypothetical protein
MSYERKSPFGCLMTALCGRDSFAPPIPLRSLKVTTKLKRRISIAIEPHIVVAIDDCSRVLKVSDFQRAAETRIISLQIQQSTAGDSRTRQCTVRHDNEVLHGCQQWKSHMTHPSFVRLTYLACGARAFSIATLEWDGLPSDFVPPI